MRQVVRRIIRGTYPLSGSAPTVALTGMSKVEVCKEAARIGVKYRGATKPFTIGKFLCKKCNKCGTTKEVDRFYSNRSRSHGIESICADCSYKKKGIK